MRASTRTIAAVTLALVVVVMVLTGCVRQLSLPTPEPDLRPTLAAPFEAHLSEYLDPAWMSQPGVEHGCFDTLTYDSHSCGLQGSVKGAVLVGKVVIVDADTGRLHDGFLDELQGMKFDNGILRKIQDSGQSPFSLATTPEEVGTVVLLWPPIKTEISAYTDGTKGYRMSYRVKVIDFEKKKVVSEIDFGGDSPPYPAKLSKGDWVGGVPWYELLVALSCAADISCKGLEPPSGTYWQ